MSFPKPDDSFVFVRVEPANLSSNVIDMPVQHGPPEMKSMHVVSNVRNRYARTVVSSKYSNPDIRAQQATFSIVLPDTAFIAGFVMDIKGKKYEAYVKEKEEAKQEYQQAVSSGRAAAHVAVSARDSNKFTVSVNVEPQSDVTFILTYEELLVRKHSKYEMVVNLHPGQILDDLGVDIHINETRPIIHVETPAIRSGNIISDTGTKNKYATIKKDSESIVHASFHPTMEQQKEMANALANVSNSNGISGQFVVEYDVERDPSGGEVLVNDGYFVHFFAPTELKPIPKHVVFVLDVSGSMQGRKIQQLKEAMIVILSELNPEDYFNIIKFEDNIQILYSNNSMPEIANSSLPASAENINKAQKVVGFMQAGGGTNISDALITALSVTSKGISVTDNNTKIQPIIVFLTDGQANSGESKYDRIIDIVLKQNDTENKSAIFTLAFGNDANKEFLKELAVKNSGFLRNIYEAADASLQLQDFYKQISSPLLTNVNFKYSEDVKEITKHKFDILFNGSEFVVTGKVDQIVDGFVVVEGSTVCGIEDFRPTIIPVCPTKVEKEKFGDLERLWAYMTIKQLLDKKYEKNYSDNTVSSETPDKRALKLALKYSFVTPVTSLVVVKPEDDLQWGSVRVASSNHLLPAEGFGGLNFGNQYQLFGCPPNATSVSTSFRSVSQPFGFGQPAATTFNFNQTTGQSGTTLFGNKSISQPLGCSFNSQQSGFTAGQTGAMLFGSQSSSQPFGSGAGKQAATALNLTSNHQSVFGTRPSGPPTGTTLFGSNSISQPFGFGTEQPAAIALNLSSNNQTAFATRPSEAPAFGCSFNSQPSGFTPGQSGTTLFGCKSISQPFGFGTGQPAAIALNLSSNNHTAFATRPSEAPAFGCSFNSQQSGFTPGQSGTTLFGSNSISQPFDSGAGQSAVFATKSSEPLTFGYSFNSQQSETNLFGSNSISQPFGSRTGQPASTTFSFNFNANTALKNVVSQSPKLKSMHVVTNVKNRHAHTVVTSNYVNQETRALPMTYSFILPDTAFVDGFVMKIKRTKIEENIRKNEQSQEEKQETVAQCLTPTHITDSADNPNKFTVIVNIEPQSEVTVILIYEQDLVQKNNKYEIVTNLYPGSTLDDLEVDVKISDNKPIANIETPVLRSKNQMMSNQYATINKNKDGSVHISFKPKVEQQKEIIHILKESDENSGISGQFVVEYNIDIDSEDIVISEERRLEQFNRLKSSAEKHITFSKLYLPMLRSISISYGSEKNISPWKTLKEGSYYLGNAYGLINTYKECMPGAINDINMQIINAKMVELQFDPGHISSGYTDEAYGGKAECFVSKGHGTVYYKMLHSELKEDIRLFIEMVERDIDVPVKRFLESVEQKLQSISTPDVPK